MLSASYAASSRCWRRRLDSWLASAATDSISSSSCSSVTSRIAPLLWARISEYQSFAIGVQEPQLAQRCGHLVGNGDLVDGTDEG